MKNKSRKRGGRDEDLEEEDNNPFVGTTHMFASGIASAPGGQQAVLKLAQPAPGEQQGASTPDGAGVVAGTAAGATGATGAAGEGEDEDEDSNENSDIRDEDVDILTQTLYKAAEEPFVSVPVRATGTDSLFKIPVDSSGPIQIKEAGDYKDPWGKHAIGYVIELDGFKTVRRYSEFYSLRKNLTLLLPTVVVPPLPPKHSIMNYIFKKSIDTRIIDSRKRTLCRFLNECYEVPDIANHIVFKKFLDCEIIWKDVLNSAPILILPHDNRLAPPLNPTKPSPLHLLLPAPNSKVATNTSILNPLIQTNTELENKFNKLEKKFWEYKINYKNLHKTVKQLENHLKLIGGLHSELGVHYNSFSIENAIISSDGNENEDRSSSMLIEKVGHAFDVSYVTDEILSERHIVNLEEPLYEFIQLLEDCKRVLGFRKAKYLQYEIVEITMDKNKKRLRALLDLDDHIKTMTNVINQSTILESRKYSNQEPISDVPDSPFSKVDYTSEGEESAHDETHADHDTPQQEHHKSDDEENIEQLSSSLHASTINANKIKVRKKLSRRRDRSARELDPNLLTEAERKQEIKILQRELDKLEDVQKLVLRDIEDVNESTLRSLEHVSTKLEQRWGNMLRQVTKAMIDFSRESLNAWRQVRKDK